MGFTRYPIETGAVEYLDKAMKHKWQSGRALNYAGQLRDAFMHGAPASDLYVVSVRAFGYYSPNQQEMLECKIICEELARLIRHNMSYRVSLEECANMFYAARL